MRVCVFLQWMHSDMFSLASSSLIACAKFQLKCYIDKLSPAVSSNLNAARITMDTSRDFGGEILVERRPRLKLPRRFRSRHAGTIPLLRMLYCVEIVSWLFSVLFCHFCSLLRLCSVERWRVYKSGAGYFWAAQKCWDFHTQEAYSRWAAPMATTIICWDSQRLCSSILG
jgi:hypothetical protein